MTKRWGRVSVRKRERETEQERKYFIGKLRNNACSDVCYMLYVRNQTIIFGKIMIKYKCGNWWK